MTRTIKQHFDREMTNSEVAKAATGAGAAVATAAASYANDIEQWSRILASWFSIAASVVVVAFAISKRFKKREKTNRKT